MGFSAPFLAPAHSLLCRIIGMVAAGGTIFLCEAFARSPLTSPPSQSSSLPPSTAERTSLRPSPLGRSLIFTRVRSFQNCQDGGANVS